METFLDKWENFLSRFDRLLAAKNPRERLIIFSLPIFLSLFATYHYLLPPVKTYHTRISGQLDTARSESDTYRRLPALQESDTKAGIEKLSAENRALRTHITEIKDLQLYSEAKRRELPFLLYNTADWSDYLHRLVSYGKKHRITMRRFTNTRTAAPEQAGMFTNVLTVDFKARGNFSHTMAFIRDIEHDPAVTEIEKLTLTASGDIVASGFTLTLWGIPQ